MEGRNLLFPLLLLAVAGGVQGLFCFTQPNCAGAAFNVPGLDRPTVRSCCVDNNGLGFVFGIGDELCNLCIVIQWLNGTSFEGPERTASYQFAIGYTKGTSDISAGDRTYSIVATPITPTGTSDFQVTPSTVTVTTTTPAIVQVNFVMDGVTLEPNETVRLRFETPFTPGFSEVLLDTIELTINDVDTVVVEFNPTSYTVTESEGVVVMFQIVKRTMTTQPVSVRFSTSPGTATATNDFIGQTGVLVTFAPSETDQIVYVTVVNDDTLESMETFTAMLTTIPGSMVMVGAADNATATITDDDIVQVMFNPSVYTVNENEETVTLMIHKIGQSGIPVTVDISTSNGSAIDGRDFMGILQQTLTFPAGGDDVIEILIPLINDTINEATEDFFSTLVTSDSKVVLCEDAASVEIVDEDEVVTLPLESTTAPPESTTAPSESNGVGPIASAVAAVVSVITISCSIIIIVIIVTRSHRAQHKEESQGATAMSGRASEVKVKENIPMTECMVYGMLGTHQTSGRGDYSVSQSFPGGVSKGQLGTQGENEDAGMVYESIPV